MNEKKLILNLLRQSSKTFNQLYDELSKKRGIKKYHLNFILNELITEKKIYFQNRSKKYFLKNEEQIFEGKFKETRHNFGFVENDEEAVFIPGKFKLNAIHGDTVRVLLFPNNEEDSNEKSEIKRTGKIIRIIKRNGDNIILRKKRDSDGLIVFIPDDFETKYHYLVETDQNIEFDDILITSFKKVENEKVYVNLKKILGKESDASLDSILLAYRNNLPRKFLETSLEEAKGFLNEKLTDQKNRTDLTKKLIFTIDGKTSKDLDDAISIQKDSKGNYYLGVHIADVSHYVKENSSLDYDAFKRGNSIYLIDTVFPMLPKILSDHLCSLTPNEKKLTLTCEIKFDKQGKILDYNVFDSMIESKFRLNYEEVNDFLFNEEKLFKNDQELTKAIYLAKELSELLRKANLKSGLIDFDLPEIQINLDEQGRPIKIWKKERIESERIIEDFMIVANQCIANFLVKKEIPGIFRIHEKPKSENIARFFDFLASISIPFRLDVSKVTSKKLMDFLIKYRENNNDFLIKRNMIQVMEKAQYANYNLGHYALASKYYLHFTSPIRRYADLVVHRYIKKYLRSKSKIKIGESEVTKNQEIALHCSKMERTAMMIEWKFRDIKKVRYLQKHNEKEYLGKIVSFSKFGIYVELSNYIQGMIPLASLQDDEYYYDENKFIVAGKKNKKVYKLGEEIRIRIASLNLVQGFINLEII